MTTTNHSPSISWRYLPSLALIYGLMLWLLLFWPFHALAQGMQYEVEIIASQEISALLKDNLQLIRWRGNAYIDPFQLKRLYREAPTEIRKLVATEGYYSPKIKTHLEKRNDTTHIRFQVDTGQPSRIDTIDLIFKGAITSQQAAEKPDLAQLRKNWTLSRGSVFRHEDWETAKTALLRQVRKIRYPKASLIESQATVDPETQQVALKVVVDSGESVRFGEIQIEGLKRYPEKTVLAKKGRLKTGDVYRESALLRWQSRLLDSGYFRTAEVSADVTANSAIAPINVMLTEYERKNLGLGLGYSTNTGNRAVASYEDLSLFGSELRLKSALSLETKKQTLNANILLPEAPNSHRDSFGGLYERTDIEGEVVRLASINAQRVWGTPRLEYGLKLEYLNEQQTLDGFDASHSQALPLTYFVTWRQLDSRLAPRRGFALQAQLGAALAPLLTDRSFVRPYLKGIFYQPLGEKDQLVMRGELGAVIADRSDGVPASVQFRAGGDQSVRGYAYQSLGTERGTAVDPARYLATASIEYQHWFQPRWGAALFVDAGNATDSFSRLDPALGYGVGGRWRSPIGPISVDLAYGRRTEEYRIHFSLGFTF